MYPVQVSISAALLDAAASLDPGGLVDILWAHARPEDGLEHIAQHVTGETVGLTLFVKSATPQDARLSAIRICQSALSAARPLAAWQLSTDDRPCGLIRIS